MNNKKLKKWGDSLVITISREEQEAYGMEQGDFIDLVVTRVVKSKHIPKHLLNNDNGGKH